MLSSLLDLWIRGLLPALFNVQDGTAQDGAAQNAATAFEWPSWTPEPIVDLWQTLDGMPWLAALIIVGIALVVGKITEVVLTRLISRLTAKTSTDLDDKIIQELHRPIFIAVFFLGLSLAIYQLDIPETFARITVQILKTLVVLVWLGPMLRVSKFLFDAFAAITDRFEIIEPRTVPLFDILTKLVIFGIAGYILLTVWNIDATPWMASAGVVGIAVGFAAKDTLANLFSGIFILADAPYKLGDYVILDSGERGMVTQVGLRSTRILTRDDIEVILPNAVIANSKIVNESGGPWEKERIRVKVSVAYGSDVDQVCDVLQQIAEEHDHICPEPKPRVRFRTFGDSGLDFELLCWIDEPVLRGRLLHEMNMDVYKTFQRLGIEIPYPKHDVYLHQVEAD